MGDAYPFGDPSIAASDVERIDRACDRFESVHGQGASPRIEDYLEGYDDRIRSILLRYLLHLDIECRQRKGDNPSAAEYEGRFSAESEVVDSVIEQAGLRSDATVNYADEEAKPKARGAVFRCPACSEPLDLMAIIDQPSCECPTCGRTLETVGP